MHRHSVCNPGLIVTGCALALRAVLAHSDPVEARGAAPLADAGRCCVSGDLTSRPAAVVADESVVVGTRGRLWIRGDTFLAGSISGGAMVINEIMYAPSAGEPEWIELLNPGDSTVNIGGWTVADASGARSNPFPVLAVPASGTVVVTRDLYQFSLVRGEPSCGASAPAGVPSLNNGGDAVILRTTGGKTIDSVAYAPHWGGSAGKSLERRNPRSPPGRDNWGECADSAGATPCALNSIAVLPLDVSLTLSGGYRIPHGTDASIEAIVTNVGTEPARTVTVRWFIDEDHDGNPEAEEEIGFAGDAGPLPPGDSLAIAVVWTDARPGAHQLIVRADVDGDRRPGNDLARSAVVVGYPPGAAVVNEIMYQPLPREGEYIELTAGDIPLDIEGWSVQLGMRDDGLPEKTVALTGAGGADVAYTVVASDSSILARFGHLSDSSGRIRLLVRGSALGLNNGGDLIRVVDPAGGTVDSVSYDPAWHDPAFTDVSGRSLEKIHPGLDGASPQSWNTSVAPEGGTPGRQNSIVAPAARHGSALDAAPNPFSPDGDGREDHTVVSYRFPVDAGYTIIRVYDVTGRLIRTLMERERGGYSGETVWDGRDGLSRRVRMGMYILHLEARSASGALVATAKKAIAVAGRL